MEGLSELLQDWKLQDTNVDGFEYDTSSLIAGILNGFIEFIPGYGEYETTYELLRTVAKLSRMNVELCIVGDDEFFYINTGHYDVNTITLYDGNLKIQSFEDLFNELEQNLKDRIEGLLEVILDQYEIEYESGIEWINSRCDYEFFSREGYYIFHYEGFQYCTHSEFKIRDLIERIKDVVV